MSIQRSFRAKTSLALRLFCGLCLLAATFSVGIPNASATDVGGIIDTDTTWTLAGSPYIVSSPVLVLEGVTLTIQPGVVVKFDSHKALQIQGKLIAQGSSDQPILFTSNISPANPGDWDYIFFTDSSVDALFNLDGNYVSGSILAYVVIEYAGGSTVENDGALRMNNAAPFIHDTTVRLSADSGIHWFGEANNTLKMIRCAIVDNVGTGVIALNNPGYTELSESLIENNNFNGVNLGDGYSAGTYVVTGNIIHDNHGGGGDYAGIAVQARGPVVLRDNLVSENGPGWGFVSVLIEAHAADISGNLIIDNEAGGMHVGSYYDYESSLRNIHDNIISDNGGVGISLSNFSGSPVIMTNNTILRNTALNNAGLMINNLDAASSINTNTILDNINTGSLDLRAIYIEYTPWGSPLINNNNISGGNGYALYNNNAQGAPNIDARYNWWGTTSSAQISALIYDWFDNSEKGIVTFSPYLEAHNLAAPISPPGEFIVTTSTTAFELSWAANPEADLAGYKVYYDTDSEYPYPGSGADQGDSPIDVGDDTELTLTGLEEGTQYTFTVTAYDADADGSHDQTGGNESWFAVKQSISLPQPPVAVAGPDQSVSTLALVTLNGSGSYDPDGDTPLTYQWAQTGGPAVTLSSPTAVSPTFTAPGDPALLTFSLIVTDSRGLASAPDTVVITVANQPPAANAGPDQGVSTLAPVTLDGSGSSDPDGDTPLTYQWAQTGGPTVTLSSPTAVSPTFTAPGDPAPLTFSLIVTDSRGLASTPDAVVITVANQPPAANAGPDQSVSTLAPVTLDGSGSSDPDGDTPLTYQWAQTSGPTVTLSSPTTVAPTFTAPNDPAALTFSLTVTDSRGLASVPDTVVITVANQPPAASAGPDQSVNTLAPVTLDGSGSSDPDGDTPLTYQWAQTSGPTVTLSSPTAVSPTFTAPNDPAVLTFSLIVTDSRGLASVPDTVVITVRYYIYLPLIMRSSLR
jgi:hypothetical protein